MLEIQNLRSGYNGMEIIKGIDISVKKGEIVALIGPNGAGKSTILKSIFNLCEIYNGNIFFLEKEITKLPTHQLIRSGISYTPQGRQVFPNLSVLENLEMGLFSFNGKEFKKERIEMVFKQFPVLREKSKQLASSLSGGQQQMLSIGRALVQKPKLMLMDEPSLGLSPKAMKELFDNMIELNQKGLTIIIVEQNAKQAVKIADRTYILENGKIALTGEKEILSHPKVRKVYFGESE
jgi:branched-chain amino acid transport system ATP-binding protein